jgi:hypothetical protein
MMITTATSTQGTCSARMNGRIIATSLWDNMWDKRAVKELQFNDK